MDVLLVSALREPSLPVRFKTGIGNYKAAVIWVRQGHEVVPAEPKHVRTLYCRSSGASEDEEVAIAGLLPPSPANIKRFVGRLTTIDRIFHW